MTETRGGLSDRQWRTVSCAADRILPADCSVGAAEAGVVRYIQRRIARPEFQHLEVIFAHGVGLLDMLAQARFGQGFDDCSGGQQDDLLREVQGIPHPRTQQFFASLFNMTIAGFLGDPRHGGNRDGAGWDAIGYRPRPVSA